MCGEESTMEFQRKEFEIAHMVSLDTTFVNVSESKEVKRHPVYKSQFTR